MPPPRARAARRGAVLVLAAVLLSACAKGAPVNDGVSAPPGGKYPLRLAMVTDSGGLGDKSFNDGAYAGLQGAKQRLGATIEVLESKSAADYQPNITALADQDFDEIFAIGFLMNKDLRYVARDYPKRHFAIVDSVIDEPNVSSVTFREQDGSFLAGALAAMVSKTKTIGFLGGMDVPLLRKFEAGFTAGARQADPRVKVVDKYVGSFDDVASGKELAGVIYDGGADVLYVAAGKSGLGAID
ncbi:MAG: BMP family ABC transporter substrate-binding protein, partial [Candidatus Eremiobacteraeota bacterium]|nr:BMP family ABC transporter substrate-binding protein [Candidatus Eremiobacteraeota bacterium]